MKSTSRHEGELLYNELVKMRHEHGNTADVQKSNQKCKKRFRKVKGREFEYEWTMENSDWSVGLQKH